MYRPFSRKAYHSFLLLTGIQRRLYSNHSKNFFGYLKSRIELSGPLTIQEYMKEVLTNPLSGYYMKQDVFGPDGDYVTSPEISQMFGELIGIWIYNEWYKLGCVKPLQLVELGPGRGTLMKDILRTIMKVSGDKPEDFSVHLIEKSTFMSDIQEEKLCDVISPNPAQKDKSPRRAHYKVATTRGGLPIYWYSHLEGVPRRFSFFVAHEFFDALPIHKLRKTDSGWREVLVDVLPGGEEQSHPMEFRYILSHSATPATSLFVNKDETRSEFEVCPEAGVIANELATRLREFGGGALIVDYGHEGTLEDTFRAFKGHKQVSPLVDPGSADLTADVDFSFIRKQVGDQVLCLGPVSQRSFLMNMGIKLRLESLLRKAPKDQREALLSNYRMLTDPQHMGERFKVMALFPQVLQEFLTQNPPAGFFGNFDK